MKLLKTLAWIGLGLLAVLAGWLWYSSRGGAPKYGPPPVQVVYGPPPASAPQSTAPPATPEQSGPSSSDGVSAPEGQSAQPGATGGGATK